MSEKVYINKIEKFLLNDTISNEEMEYILGEISKPSKSRTLVGFVFERIYKGRVI